MTNLLVEKLADVRDFRKILETTVKELGEQYEADVSQIVLSNPLDSNITSICEYVSNPDEPVNPEIPCTTFPIHLEGGGLGIVNISRTSELTEPESNEIRITLSQISNLLRYAQINDIVQRDTFRNAFMSEITTLMTLPMGLGDALFMVVNILGKALNCNRCVFICTDDQQAGWRCFEYWQRERVESCQEYGWPTKDSALVSQTLLSSSPLAVYEGQAQSYLTPVQEEMQFIGVRSLLSVPLRSEVGCHGAIIVQACESRHAWTRDEIDMVQNAADAVASALMNLPEEKKDLEPIMRLHQREVADTKEAAQQNIQDIRKALKGALGQTAIPTAKKTEQVKKMKAAPPPPPPEPAYAEPAGHGQEPQYQQDPAAAYQGYGEYTGDTVQQEGYADPQAQGYDNQQGYSQQEKGYPEEYTEGYGQPQEQTDPGQWQQQESMGGLADLLSGDEQGQPAPKEAGRASLSGLLGGILGNARSGASSAGAWDIQTSQPLPPEVEEQGDEAPPAPPQQAQDLAALDAIPTPGTGRDGAPQPPFQPQFQPQAKPAAQKPAAGGNKWGDLDGIPAPGQAKPQGPQPQALAGKWGDLDSIPAPGGQPPAQPAAQPQAKGSKWGDLDSIPSPKSGSDSWGNLDSIPTPGGSGGPTSSGGPGRGGLAGGMMGKARASAVLGGQGLSAAFGKGRQAAQAQYVDGPPIEVDEAAAEEKIKNILSQSNPTSDYIFDTPDVDPRLLGRIDGWVSQVETKDKYVGGQARQVAEYSCAVARIMGLSEDEIITVRLAAICHDVGKLGLPGQVLLKADEELTDAELVQTMNHPIDGARLLEGFPELAHLAPIVLAHHEEYGGNGYPEGIAGEDIPLESRIILVANAYHSMVCDKTNSTGMNPQQAQQELLNGSGSAYDPNVVQALIACIRQGLVPDRIY